MHTHVQTILQGQHLFGEEGQEDTGYRDSKISGPGSTKHLWKSLR